MLSLMRYFYVSVFIVITAVSVVAQTRIKGKIYDNSTKEPVVGASVRAAGLPIGTSTNTNGEFVLNSEKAITELLISSVGFQKKEVSFSGDKPLLISLEPSVENLQQVVVTANREASLRTQAPVAISKLSPSLINDSKATNMYEIINKTPGVVMMNYNNEQHGMGIRQPMGTSAYFLYLEDGVPIRPMGVFNHNAIIEMNIFAISSVEIVKGPASSLYGPEAVGGAINFITQRPTALPTARVGIQFDNYGYRRVQYGAGATLGKFGLYLGGYVAKQTNSWQSSSDFDKTSFNARAEYKITDKTRLTGTLSYNDYYSQTGGSVDSIAFYKREYSSSADFTYRKVLATRTRVSLEHSWNNHAETTITPYYRNNSIGQNPSYSIRWTSGSKTATGEVNDNSFKSYGMLAQHSQKFSFLNAKLLVGGMYDYSTNPYYSYRIDLNAQLRPDGKSVEKYTITKVNPDIFLVKYDSKIYNTAVFGQFDFEPVQKLRFSLGLRYDRMSFDYLNYLDNNSTGTKAYSQVTPKIGMTYDLGQGRGFYANYSQGFSPPGLTSVFRKNPNPAPGEAPFYYNLTPAYFDNKEIGGWASFLHNKLYFDWAFYQMDGRNELLSVRQPDNSTDYQSAGKTLHRGIEYGITYKPSAEWFIRFGGTNAIHRYEEFLLSTKQSDVLKDVNGKDMPSAPSFVANTEVTYKPKWAKGLRTSIEWQRISSYYQNQVNTVKYDDKTAFGLSGVSVLNLRAGYTFNGIEFFTNIMNLTDELYANQVTRGNNATDRSTYTPAAPRTFVFGIQYNFVGNK
ncbi:Outer membrane receptor proteins, mostly Fe transport [Pseudarcicella hirudinis]|uniref:Outer membrane receptor proteins, mostly Fe transport n=1 Tax=Pseudarcicella hirudinis TaxID=1079859 RepID=A0A1I5RI82_9BACT|nr:TonB-dependent receptor [Pseudarcicella hirudinis]SFP58215.1 Outer membrane receptor proteins, mostly Fe transport [Pseudarcicella hirudinis]